MSLSSVRASQDLSGAARPMVMRYLAIPAAWPLTVVGHRLGLTANAATLLRALLALLALGLIAAPVGALHLAGLVLYGIALVLDHVDGNLCRMDDSASFFGKYFDGLVDAISESLLPLAIALNIWLMGGSGLLLLAGAGAAMALVLIQNEILRHAITAREIKIAKAAGGKSRRRTHGALEAWLAGPGIAPVEGFLDRHALNLLWDLRYGGLLVAVPLGAVDVYLYLVAATHIGVLAALIPLRLLRGYAEFDIHRRSRSAAARTAE